MHPLKFRCDPDFVFSAQPRRSCGQTRRAGADDPRADRLLNAFATHWLRLRKVGMFPPDTKPYPYHGDHPEQSMIGKTLAFFREVVRGGHSLRELIDSNWSTANFRPVGTG